MYLSLASIAAVEILAINLLFGHAVLRDTEASAAQHGNATHS
jgi:hypothetical protein